MARNLVVCCDGTSNEPVPSREAGATNVVRLFRCLEKSDEQLVFYDPGVGTSGILDLWRRHFNQLKALAERATGYGLDAHVVSAYRFLCEQYRPGDRICIFGFSRGAYTARVVAGLIHQVGILRPEQCNLADFALKAYKQSGDEDDLSIGGRFARALGTRRATIHFLGLWDTVGSMIAPLKDRIGFGLTHLPFTRNNRSVACVRHAMAIDERRRLFRLNPWQAGDFVANWFDQANTTRPQDVKQVWFAGAHGDIGGGYAEPEAGVSKTSLLWMAGEAAQAGIRVDRAALARVTSDQIGRNGELIYCAADPMGKLHAQPTGPWWAIEYLPKTASMREWPERRALLGYYLPAAEPRPIDAGATIHESVRARMDQGYAPVNLGSDTSRYGVETTTPV
jgi:uncharacterized protein (DUF2235 family)